jgi:hypothetical protein
LRSADINDISLTTEHDARENLNVLRRNYKILKRNAVALRSTWLEEVASARSSEGNLSIAQEIRNLTTREKQRRDARTIKNSISSVNRRALSSIEVLSEGAWVELSEQADIERALQSELASHFNQAASTPFCQDPLLSDIGPYATMILANEILRGNYSPPDLDHWAAQLLPFFQQEIPTEGPKYCSIQQHIAGWK